MKFLAVLLMVCILSLSTFAGMVKAAVPTVKEDCCKHMAGKACHQKPAKDDDCSKSGCAMLFSCSICGFLMVEPVRVKPSPATQIAQSVTPYKTGHLSAYASSDWKPPKTV